MGSEGHHLQGIVLHALSIIAVFVGHGQDSLREAQPCAFNLKFIGMEVMGNFAPRAFEGRDGYLQRLRWKCRTLDNASRFHPKITREGRMGFDRETLVGIEG